MLDEEAWGAVCQFMPQMFSGIEVKAFCGPLVFFHSSLPKQCLNGSCIVSCWNMFMHVYLVSGNCTATAYKDILYSCDFSLGKNLCDVNENKY